MKIHEERQNKINHVIYDRKVFGFSDCAYLFFYYKDGIEDKMKDDANLVYISAFDISLTALRLMNRGYLVRGGIAFGNAYFDHLSFFGPAVERAHEIESKIANFPRLQFDQEIGKVVFDWDHNLDNKDSNLLGMYLDLPFLTEKDQSHYFVNPVYEVQKNEFIQIGVDHIDMDSVKMAIKRKTKLAKEIYTDDQRIISKLDWINNYLSQKRFALNTDRARTIFSSTTT